MKKVELGLFGSIIIGLVCGIFGAVIVTGFLHSNRDINATNVTDNTRYETVNVDNTATTKIAQTINVNMSSEAAYVILDEVSNGYDAPQLPVLDVLHTVANQLNEDVRIDVSYSDNQNNCPTFLMRLEGNAYPGYVQNDVSDKIRGALYEKYGASPFEDNTGYDTNLVRYNLSWITSSNEEISVSFVTLK